MKLPAPLAFDWDKGNLEKNWKKHRVYYKEAEEIFLNRPLVIFKDLKHSGLEKRHVSYGVSKRGRKLTIVFTYRDNYIRIISARDQDKKEPFMKKAKLKKIPKFKNEDEERNFWANHDTTEYFDTSKPIEFDLSKLKPTTESISLRLPAYLLMRIKEIANSKDVPYQSLMKIFLAERVEKELKSASK